jgi:3-oxoacyl-[acyl-carrier protein] reductase
MDKGLGGKTALVTGASRGIGRAIARRLAADGASVIIHCHQSRAAAEALAAELGSGQVVQADLGSVKEIDAMFASLGGKKLDILVNNAGIWIGTPLGKTSAEDVDRILEVNIKSVFWVTQDALPLLNEGARIINISSVAGRVGVRGGRSLYGATKAAIDAFTRNWALELADRKILVNAVAPGYVTTDMTNEHFSDVEVRKRAIERSPLGRLGNAEEVADVVAFLCSHEARWITGQILNVSGGFVI